jgi:acylphosphatase
MKRMRKKIIYKGRVQGVGFRWNTGKAVECFDVTGYVKNLPNGSVELLLEGCSGEVSKAENSVEERMRGYWTEKESEELPGDHHWQKFKIHY